MIEAVAESAAKAVVKKIKQIKNKFIPIIGIGASADCNGQILVTDDMIGLSDFSPKFVKRYSNLKKIIKKSIENYAKDVKFRKFPSNKNAYK